MHDIRGRQTTYRHTQPVHHLIFRETTPAFDREFVKLDPTIQRGIGAYLLDISQLPDPGGRGKDLTGNRRGSRTAHAHHF